MKKVLLLSLLLSSLIFADKIRIPMPASSLSIENSGTLSAIDAYRDGVGIFTVEQIGSAVIDNSEMNELVYKYGEDAKYTDVLVKDYVNNYGNSAEKLKALELGKFEPMVSTSIADDTLCDDNNAQTINDKYTNGICAGEIPTVVYNDNGTIKCENATVGQSFSLDGVSYLVVDNTTIRNNLGRVASICTSKVTNMNQLFYNNTTFNEPLNHWDVSNVTTMQQTFYSASSFNQSLNNWNTSNVTNMQHMFRDATSFNQPLNNWNVSNVTNMFAMFYSASSFNQSLSNWNVSNVTSMGTMFFETTSFNQPLNSWDVSKVTVMHYMFSYANSFNQPLNNWNTSNVTAMHYMFYNATLFNQYIKNWNVLKVTNAGNFRIGSALTLANSPF